MTDLKDMGYREIDILGDLLKAYSEGKGNKNNKLEIFESLDSFGFNPNSGCVYLIDEYDQTAMMNGENLEDFIFCPECGNEAFLSEFDFSIRKCCKDYMHDIGAMK